MKPRDIQRSVRSVRIERAAGDAPSIGRVGRVPGTGLSKGARRRRRRGEGGRGNRERDKRKNVMLAWSAVLVVAALGVVVVSVWLWLLPNMDSDGESGVTKDSAVLERVVSRFDSPSEQEALTLVRRALQVRETAKVGEFFRGDDVSPEEIVSFLRRTEKTDGPISDCEWLSSMDANGLLLDGVRVNSKTAKGLHNRLAILTPDERGKWKIDFDAYARTVKPSWDELLEKNADRGVVRVMVAKDSYFNGPFKDDTQWICHAMASPDTEMVLLGYCRKDTPQAAAMARIIAGGENTAGARSLTRATLEIRRREGGENRQFEIVRVLAEDWVMAAKPFDENFK